IENEIFKRSIITFFGVMLCSLTIAQELIWLETEKFDDHGGWTNDWQFLDQMGSSYLLASGIGSPVEDAYTQVNASITGKYRIWVRTKNWDTTHSPGQFSLLLNEEPLQKTFGKSRSDGWTWEDGGIVSLVDQNKIALRDKTGYYGRCDVIVISSDLEWTPPNDRASIDSLRIKYHAISQEVEDKGEYDVVVIGGGLAGTLAAVAAAREGSKTVLIQNRDQLGGNASLEILVPPVGVVQTKLEEEHKKFDVRETGLIEEIAAYGNQRYFTDGKKYPERLLKLVQSEPNLDLFLKTHATEVIMDDANQIKAIIAITVPDGDRLKFHGKLFLDCTGNGIIGVKAG
ncbi:MAG: FAD-dependent oxidoreductase, partial [Anditalea sp.]